MKIFTKSTGQGNWLRTPLTFLGMLVVFCAYSQNPFITTWKTDNPGTSNSTSITIPTHPDFPYNYEVDWDDDGTFDQTGITGNVTHDFGTAGTKTIRIRGAFPSIFFNETGDRQKILDVSQWGDIAWTSMGQSFVGCSNLNISATDVPNLAAVSSMFQMFKDCSSLNGPANIGTWNTGSVRNMEKVFFGASIFNQPIGNWNTAMVNNMTGMFRDATAFDQPIGNWNTGEVTSMFGIFAGASNFNQPIGNWNVAKVKNMNSLFENALLFNQPIGNWNTAEATDMGAMFRNASAFNQPIGNWNTAKVMSMDAMFRETVLFNQPIGNWNTAEVKNMSDMFLFAMAFDQPIGNWNTAKVTNMGQMFQHASVFNQPIGNWNTAMVASMNAMFRDAAAFNQNIGAWTLNPSVDLTLMLDDCGMDCANYSATLIGWNANPLTPDARSLGANGRTYETATVTARTNLTATKGWTINGDAIISTIFYADADSDGSGNPAVSQNACTAPNGYVANSMDCNDGNASAFPGGTEICDGVDNDCNGTIDDVAACGSAGTRTWTGFVSTDWHTPCNWNPGCVPTADDDVIIPNETNDPTISAAAVAKSVVNASGSVLTVAATGLLTLNGSTSFQGATTAFGNNGTVHNNGSITIGSTTTPGLYGLHNRFVFNNNTDGQINIDRPNFIGLYNQEGTFNNAAAIIIGSIPIAISMDQGLWNEATFNNNTGGQISIDRTSDAGLYNTMNGIFTNAATITIGAVESVGNYGVTNYTTFNNNTGGQITIDNTTDAGIWNQSGTFANAASILIGANVNIGTDGIVNYSTFNNNLGGQINIDRFALSGIFNASNFTNAAKITIGANTNGAEKGIFNYYDATFINANCAQIFMHQPLWNVSTFTNNGLFWVNTSTEHLNFGTVTNNGIIEYPQGNPIPNVVNNEITVAPTTANTCDAISPAFGLGSPVDFTIVGIFTDASATMSAGTYTTATNTFTPTSILVEGTYTFYVKIEDGDGGCIRIATWQLTTENCCDAPVADCKTATIVLVGNSASLDVSAVNNGSTYDCGLQSMTVSPNSFSCSHVGIPQTITLTVTDVNGNSDDCQTTVTVQDNTAPTITCPNDRTVNADAGECSGVQTYTVTASDNCSYTLTHTNGLASGSAFPLGFNVVNWQVTDVDGNSTVCSFSITVVDNQLPSIVCPSNITKVADPGQCTAVTTYPNPNFSDNCTGAYLTRTSGLASGSAFPVGTHTVNWKATDAGGNTTVCNFTVTVSDTQAPVITCPANMVKNTGAGLCTAVVSYTTPTVTDNCSNVSVERTSAANTASGSAFAKGATQVTWKATDAGGLTATCGFTVTVNDAQAPTATCPGNQTRATDTGLCTAVVSYTTPTFTDNCTGGSMAIQSGLVSGSAFPKGITTVIWRATDAAGLTKTCSFRVTVNDTQTPTFTLCPSSQSVSTDAGLCTAAVTYALPTATDNCTAAPSVVKQSGLASGSHFPKGTSAVVWRATDGVGLTKICSFTVTVTDAQLPTITCPANIAVTAAPGQCSAVVTYANPDATDNCALTSNYLLSGLASGSLFSQGATTNTWKATDNSGLTNTCAFTVTVICGTGSEQVAVSRNELAVPTIENRQMLAMNLVPNPATTQVLVTVEGITSETLASTGSDLSVFDAQGRIVLHQSNVLSPTSKITVADLPSGLYFVTLRSAGTVVTKRLVKVK